VNTKNKQMTFITKSKENIQLKVYHTSQFSKYYVQAILQIFYGCEHDLFPWKNNVSYKSVNGVQKTIWTQGESKWKMEDNK
jgi:hypothetical protein